MYVLSGAPFGEAFYEICRQQISPTHCFCQKKVKYLTYSYSFQLIKSTTTSFEDLSTLFFRRKSPSPLFDDLPVWWLTLLSVAVSTSDASLYSVLCPPLCCMKAEVLLFLRNQHFTTVVDIAYLPYDCYSSPTSITYFSQIPVAHGGSGPHGSPVVLAFRSAVNMFEEVVSVFGPTLTSIEIDAIVDLFLIMILLTWSKQGIQRIRLRHRIIHTSNVFSFLFRASVVWQTMSRDSRRLL